MSQCSRRRRQQKSAATLLNFLMACALVFASTAGHVDARQSTSGNASATGRSAGTSSGQSTPATTTGSQSGVSGSGSGILNQGQTANPTTPNQTTQTGTPNGTSQVQTNQSGTNPTGQTTGGTASPTGASSGNTIGQGNAGGEPSGTSVQGNQAGNGIGGAPSTRGVRGTQTGAAIVTNAPSTLSLAQAIQLALQNNLATLLARERAEEARGLARESLSALLPNLSAASYQANRTVNLRAQGIQFSGAPTLVGPFNNFDARLNLAQAIFDLSALRRYRAGRFGIEAARLQEPLARQQVATGVTLAYLDVLRAGEQARAAQSNFELAQSLLKLAQDQRNAGVATGVDVARAATRVAEEVVRVTEAQTSAEQTQLVLQRIVGIPQGAPLTLVDTLQFTQETFPAIETALAQSTQNRFEIRIAEAELTQRGLERRAISAEQLPSLAFTGDYGLSGSTPFQSDLPTRSAAVRVNVPIFNGGLTRARLSVATSQQRQAELQLGDVRGQVEEDVRLALVGARTSAEQVRASEATVRLAERELQLARDRFQAGVADNVEVISAQTALENARATRVAALAAYNVARANLAAALGQAETFRL